MNQDSIQLVGRFDPFGKRKKAILIVDVIINEQKVEWSYVDPLAIADFWMSHKSRRYPGAHWSVFEPFSCTCGCAGCSGIYDGIYVKARKHSVEWRMRKDTGYDRVLSKRFYSFARAQYEQARNDLLQWLRAYQDPEYELCASFGACPGREVTVRQFLRDIEA
jgi:hypothetical protein